MTIEQIATVCHGANRAYCQSIGDFSQVDWVAAPAWQVDSALIGVRKAIDGATPEQLHESWCAQKFADGWRYGDVKDPDKKTHPCLMPYAELPTLQRRKDALFSAVVNALKP